MHFLAWLHRSFRNGFCFDSAMGNSLWPMKKCNGLLDEVFSFLIGNISCITQQLKGICSCAHNPIVQLTRGVIDFLCFLPHVSNYCCGSQENNSFGKQVEHNNSQPPLLSFSSILSLHSNSYNIKFTFIPLLKTKENKQAYPQKPYLR